MPTIAASVMAIGCIVQTKQGFTNGILKIETDAKPCGGHDGRFAGKNEPFHNPSAK